MNAADHAYLPSSGGKVIAAAGVFAGPTGLWRIRVNAHPPILPQPIAWIALKLPQHVLQPAAVLPFDVGGSHGVGKGMVCALCIALGRRLCRRPVGTFHASPRVWQHLRQVSSERTMSSEATNRGHADKEREPWTSDCRKSMRS